MPDYAHRKTDKQLDAMERKLRGIYSRAHTEVQKSWSEYMTESAKKIKPLQDAYDAAKKSGDKDAIKKAGKALASAQREQTLMNDHYKRMVERTAKELSQVNEMAVAYINGELPKTYATNYNFFGNQIAREVPKYTFELVDANTVANLVKSDKTLLPTRKLDVAKDKRWNTKRINSEVLQGILQGESMPKIAERLQKVEHMNAESAIRNARTMVTGAENKGRMDMLKRANEYGIETKKRWIATIDNRTRDWHAELNGALQEWDEPFVNSVGEIMFPGDPDASGANVYNCRCTLGSEITGFRRTLSDEQMRHVRIEVD